MVASANDRIQAASAAINYTVEPDFGTFYVNNDISLNVRVLPSKAAASLGGLSRGDLVEVTGRVYENGSYTYWVQIHFNGQTAYVRDCLQTAKPAPLPTPASQNTGYTGTTDSYGFKADSNSAYKMNYTVNVASGTYLALHNAKCMKEYKQNIQTGLRDTRI